MFNRLRLKLADTFLEKFRLMVLLVIQTRWRFQSLVIMLRALSTSMIDVYILN